MNDLIARSQVMMAENSKTGTAEKPPIVKWRGKVKNALRRCETDRFQEEIALYQEVIHWGWTPVFWCRSIMSSKIGTSFTLRARCDAWWKTTGAIMRHVPTPFLRSVWYQSLSDAIKQAQVTELETSKEKVLKYLTNVCVETMKNMDKSDGILVMVAVLGVCGYGFAK